MATAKYTPVAKSSNGTPLFECLCPDCGKIRIQDKRKIGKPCMSCSNKRRRTHGLSGTAIYRLWSGMRARCTYPSVTHYKYYGGRGISVHQEWSASPDAFFEWAYKNGYKEGLELDRIDPDGNYTPDNCRFIPHMENSQLRRNARCNREQAGEAKKLLASGMTAVDVAAEVGIPYMTVWHINKGNTWHNA